MCIGSKSVNQAQDLMSVTKFEDFPYSLLPNIHLLGKSYDLEHRIDLFNMCMQCRVQSV